MPVYCSIYQLLSINLTTYLFYLSIYGHLSAYLPIVYHSISLCACIYSPALRPRERTPSAPPAGNLFFVAQRRILAALLLRPRLEQRHARAPTTPSRPRLPAWLPRTPPPATALLRPFRSFASCRSSLNGFLSLRLSRISDPFSPFFLSSCVSRICFFFSSLSLFHFLSVCMSTFELFICLYIPVSRIIFNNINIMIKKNHE